MIAIIDYGLGNLTSVKNALDNIGVANKITNAKKDIVNAKGIIFPGVGAAGAGMTNLRAKKLDMLLVEQIQKGKPFLGTCLGMQLLFEFSEENNTRCLGIFKGNVKRFKTTLKVPQIGWNQVIKTSRTPLLRSTGVQSYFYFVNSYYCVPKEKSIVVGKTNYGKDFASVIQKNNVFATQFHSEKSGDAGLQLLKNFSNICL